MIDIEKFRARRDAIRCDIRTGVAINGVGWTESVTMPDGQKAGHIIPFIDEHSGHVKYRWQGFFCSKLQGVRWDKALDAMEAVDRELIAVYGK